MRVPWVLERRDLRSNPCEGAPSSDNSCNAVVWRISRKLMRDLLKVLEESTSDSEHIAVSCTSGDEDKEHHRDAAAQETELQH